MIDGIPKIAEGAASREIARRMVATSTDPAFVASQLGEDRDGRRRRSARMKGMILDACRTLMLRGTLRPPAARVAEIASCSMRTVFERFPTIEELYVEALRDEAVRHSILERVLGADWEIALCWCDGEDGAGRLLRAIVTGRTG